jgi:hypothetical protein
MSQVDETGDIGVPGAWLTEIEANARAGSVRTLIFAESRAPATATGIGVAINFSGFTTTLANACSEIVAGFKFAFKYIMPVR